MALNKADSSFGSIKNRGDFENEGDIYDLLNKKTVYDSAAGQFGDDVKNDTHVGPLTANTTITQANQIVGVDTSAAAVTVTLATSLLDAGVWLIISDEGGSAATNAVTIDSEGSATFDGALSSSISANYGTFYLYSDGTNWFSAATTSGGSTL